MQSIIYLEYRDRTFKCNVQSIICLKYRDRTIKCITISSKDGTRHIELLTEVPNNFSSWFVNIRAELRTKKLWKYTQEVYESEEQATTEEGQEKTLTKKEEKAIKEWEEKCQESADIMTPTISPGMQLKLSEPDYNNGYLMLVKLRIELQPGGDSEFIRLSKEYYTLQFKTFKSVPEYLTRIKVLEEKIDATKVVLDTNSRTILCLSMSLPQEYQYLVQIWAVSPLMTAEKARQMVLEASRQHSQALHNSYDPALSMRAQGQGQPQGQGHRERCKYCESTYHREDRCWAEFPDKAPEWFKMRMKEQASGSGQKADHAKEWMKKLGGTAAMARRDDFEDYSGTRYSA